MNTKQQKFIKELREKYNEMIGNQVECYKSKIGHEETCYSSCRSYFECLKLRELED